MALELTHQQRLATIAPHLGHEYWDRLPAIDFPSIVADHYNMVSATGVVDGRDSECAPFVAGDLRVTDGFWRRSVGFLAVPLPIASGSLILRAKGGRGGLGRTPGALRGLAVLRDLTATNLPSSLSEGFEGFTMPQSEDSPSLSDTLATVISERLGDHDVELRDGWLIGYTAPRPVTDAFSVRRLSETVRALQRSLARAA